MSSMKRSRSAIGVANYPGDANMDVLRLQEAKVERRNMLREWLKAHHGWRTISEISRGTGMGKMIISETVRDNPHTFTRKSEDPAGHHGHERWVIRRHHHLEAHDG